MKRRALIRHLANEGAICPLRLDNTLSPLPAKDAGKAPPGRGRAMRLRIVIVVADGVDSSLGIAIRRQDIPHVAGVLAVRDALHSNRAMSRSTCALVVR